jgi:hypothetical protein
MTLSTDRGALQGVAYTCSCTGRMQPHEQYDPPRKPDPRDKQMMWLLLVLAVLLGRITTRLLGRLFF